MAAGKIIVKDQAGKVIDMYTCRHKDCDTISCASVKCNYYSTMEQYYKQYFVEWDFEDQ